MAQATLSIKNWNMGGISESRVLGTEDSLYKMVGVNVHDEVGLIKNNRRLMDIAQDRKAEGDEIDEFVQVMIPCSNNRVYAFSSESGKVWEYVESKWELVYTAVSDNGESKILGACEYNGYIYFATQNDLYKMQLEFVDEDWDTYVSLEGHLNVDPVVGDLLYMGGNTQTYTLPTSISESATGKTSFIPVLRSITGVAINIGTKPSTSLTVTIHDSSNNVFATKTVLAANLTTGINKIFFTTPVNYIEGQEYHVHVTQTGTGGVIKTAVANEQTGMYLTIYGESNTNYHPMIVQNNVLFIGDGFYVHQVENTLFLWALDIPRNQQIKCLGKMDIDLLIGTEVSSMIHSAMIFRWNTWSESWTIEDEIPERSINAFVHVDNYIYVIAGSRANVYFYNGQTLELWRRVGGTFRNSQSVKVYPNAVASINGIPIFGISNFIGNPIEQGIYSMGTVNARQYPRIFNLEYVPSAGMEDIQIGAICTLGDDVFMSWEIGEQKGMDKTHPYNLYSGAFIQTRVFYKDRNVRSTYRKAIINYHSILQSEYEKPSGLSGVYAGHTGGQNYFAGFPTSTEGGGLVVFNPDTNRVEIAKHGLMEGEAIVFTSDGHLPAELDENTVYYVYFATNVTEDSFQLSDEEGNLVEFSDEGYGIHKVHLHKLIRLYYRKDYETGWREVDLIHDPDKNQFISESWGDFAFCLELKMELRAWAGMTSTIDEITLYSE